LAVKTTPTIYDIPTDTYYNGLTKVIEYYESITNINNLFEKSKQFKINFPDYRINDISK